MVHTKKWNLTVHQTYSDGVDWQHDGRPVCKKTCSKIPNVPFETRPNLQ